MTITATKSDLDDAKVGDGATFQLHTDCHAGTIIDRRGWKSQIIIWQRDKATLLNGFDSGEPDALTFTPGGFAGHTEGTQRYSYEPDPNGEIKRFSRRELRNGEAVWKLERTPAHGSGLLLYAGRHEFHDFNF